jgi:hypothetical protein
LTNFINQKSKYFKTYRKRTWTGHFKKNIQAHGGTIKAENSGLGVTFTITLPKK